jgi:adenine-specific DNA-methyltransferase
MNVTEETSGLIDRTEARRQTVAALLDEAERVRLGQFFTPARVASLIATLPRLPESGSLRVLDPGAGVGSLTAAFVARALMERPDLTLHLTAFELDDALHGQLVATLEDCRAAAARLGTSVTFEFHGTDFIEWACREVSGSLFNGDRRAFDLVVMNPPYRKINVSSPERRMLANVGVEITNLYVAFLALAAELLDSMGQIAAITPRSFANGPYFRSFRRFFFQRVRLDRLHSVESRSTMFADAAVLQENIIFAVTKDGLGRDGTIVLSASVGDEDQSATRAVPYTEVVNPDDPEQFVRIAADDRDVRVAAVIASLPATLGDLGLSVSTGRVVDFRAREALRHAPGDNTVPLIYPGHLRRGRVVWPTPGSKKPNALVRDSTTEKLLLPADTYVLVKRFSAKEERRRVVAAVFDAEAMPCAKVGFENHLNVYHRDGQGISPDLAWGLCCWLNSTVVDRFVRQFNGHTQINATDLRSLRYPSSDELVALGEAFNHDSWPAQDVIDALVEEHVTVVRSAAGYD